MHELRTHADALSLRTALRDGDGRLVVLGAGLVGMEVASSARALGLEVTLIEAAPTPLARALPPALGHWIAGCIALTGSTCGSRRASSASVCAGTPRHCD